MKQGALQNKYTLIKWLFVLAFALYLLRSATDGGDTIMATDDQGNTWQMTTAKDPPLRHLFNRKVKPGPPMTVGANVQRQGSTMRLDLVIKGQAGETYRPTVYKDGRSVRSSAPSFTVVGRSGTVFGSGTFRFG